MAEYEQEEQEGLEDYEEPAEEQKDLAESKKISGHTGAVSSGFKDLLLKPEILRAINECGFEHPSEVQQACIPQAILGQDLICQAKSGMGKTAVYVLSVLHQLKETSDVKVLVLCHTRELAYQIKNEFIRMSAFLDKIKIGVIYGGVPIKEHRDMLKKDTPPIVVGTPGRVLSLINEKTLKLDKLEFFILDECDKMLEQLDMRTDVQKIFKSTPQQKQCMMFSATMGKGIRPVCKRFMQNPMEIFIDDESKLTLHGLQQYYVKLVENEKNRKLNDLLDALLFNQVVIFVKSSIRAVHLNKLLCECNFPSICIHGQMNQKDRIARYKTFKDFNKRIMVATDIFGRGIDIERVNIVINYDMPDSTDTYLHRVGRAGRFGTKGLAITFVASEDETGILTQIHERFEIEIGELPEQIDTTSYMNS